MIVLKIDINCDVGEGIDNEASILPLISSCNIACGGHAGNIETMTKIVFLAKKHKVKVGAHPSYPDKKNFGRVSMQMEEHDLIECIQKQIYDFVCILKKENVNLHHIKAHGALYNDIAKNYHLAKTFLLAIKEFKQNTHLYVPYGSIIAREALLQNFKVKYEAFADRSYNTDLSLVSRKLPNAIIEDPKKVIAQILLIAKKHKTKTISRTFENIFADTFCIHGDTTTALQILTYLTLNLPNNNIKIARE